MGTIAENWKSFFDRDEIPKACRFCDEPRVVRNGTAERTAIVREGEETVSIEGILLRRVRCLGCWRGWRLYPPGLLPRRRFQLDVVADAVEKYLFDPEVLAPIVATSATCVVSTLFRWIRWVAGITEPAHIEARLVEVLDAPFVPAFPEVVVRNAKAGGVILRRAAANLVLVEALARSLGGAQPGLRSLLLALVAGRDRWTTYARPIVPEFASRGLGSRSGTLTM